MLMLMSVILMPILLKLNTGYADTDADLCIRSMFLFFTYKTPSFNDYFIHVRNIENEQIISFMYVILKMNK